MIPDVPLVTLPVPIYLPSPTPKLSIIQTKSSTNSSACFYTDYDTSAKKSV